MQNDLSEDFREGFKQTLEDAGIALDFHGERRRALRDRLEDGDVRYQFLEEFAVKHGDRFTEIATETHYEVIAFQSIPIAGGFLSFEITAMPVS